MAYLKVKDENGLYRNEYNNSLINMDKNEYDNYIEEYKKKYNEKQKINEIENDMNSIKNDIEEIKSLLRNFINGS
jgi:hypothetical protein